MSFPFLGIAFVYLHKYNRYITFLKSFHQNIFSNSIRRISSKSQSRKSTGSYIINNSLNKISQQAYGQVGIVLYSKLINFMFLAMQGTILIYDYNFKIILHAPENVCFGQCHKYHVVLFSRSKFIILLGHQYAL